MLELFATVRTAVLLFFMNFFLMIVYGGLVLKLFLASRTLERGFLPLLFTTIFGVNSEMLELF